MKLNFIFKMDSKSLPAHPPPVNYRRIILFGCYPVELGVMPVTAPVVVFLLYHASHSVVMLLISTAIAER